MSIQTRTDQHLANARELAGQLLAELLVAVHPDNGINEFNDEYVAGIWRALNEVRSIIKALK